MVLTKANSHLKTEIPGYDLKLISLFADSPARYTNIQPCIHFYDPSGLNVHSRYPESITVQLMIYFPFALRRNRIYDYSSVDCVADFKFFDQSIIRKSKRTGGENGGQEVVYTGEVAAGAKVTILEQDFTDAGVFTIENTGETALRFYIAASPADEVPPIAIELQPGDEGEYTLNQPGATGNTFFMAFNPEEEGVGEYVVGI